MTTLRTFFGWPDGGVWSNLIASAAWVPLAALWHRRKLREHAAELRQHLTDELRRHDRTQPTEED